MAWFWAIVIFVVIFLYQYLKYVARVKVSAQFMVDRQDEMRRIRNRRNRRRL